MFNKVLTDLLSWVRWVYKRDSESIAVKVLLIIFGVSSFYLSSKIVKLLKLSVNSCFQFLSYIVKCTMIRNWIGLVVLFSVVNLSLTVAGYCKGSQLKGVTFTATCEYDFKTVPCEDPVKPGTKARIACQVGYKKPVDRIVQDVLSCDDLKGWDYSPFRCDPICGIENSKSTSSEIVPWHAAIYKARGNGNEHICGGTIINPKVILSAAHCFWLEASNSLVNYSLITVGVGKIYKNFSAEEPFPVQYLKVSEINVPSDYMGSLSAYRSDIAILVLVDNIRFMFHVRPICLQWEDYHEKHLETGKSGQLAVWGSSGTELGARTQLRIVELPSISHETCRNAIDTQFRNSVSGDKFCVSSLEEEVLRPGDEGAGFVVSKVINGVKTFFLAGVVSNSYFYEGQRSWTITLTNIQYHQSMIMHYESVYRPK